MFNMGMTEMIIIGAIALIIIGPKKMPDLARALGRGIKEFRKASTEFKSTIANEIDKTAGTEVKDLAKMADQLKMKNTPKNIEDYLEQAANVLDDAGTEVAKDTSEKTSADAGSDVADNSGEKSFPDTGIKS
jgi:sec-independent protein translocase protein TatA